MQREERSCTSFSDNPPGQPLASKMQSPFHQRSLHGLSPSLFYSCLLSFLVLFLLLYFSFPFYFHRLSPSLSSSHLSLVEYDGGDSHSYVSQCADECWLQWGTQRQYKRFCACVATTDVRVCEYVLMFVCTYVNHLMATYWWQQRSVASSSAAVRG